MKLCLLHILRISIHFELLSEMIISPFLILIKGESSQLSNRIHFRLKLLNLSKLNMRILSSKILKRYDINLFLLMIPIQLILMIPLKKRYHKIRILFSLIDHWLYFHHFLKKTTLKMKTYNYKLVIKHTYCIETITESVSLWSVSL